MRELQPCGKGSPVGETVARALSENIICAELGDGAQFTKWFGRGGMKKQPPRQPLRETVVMSLGIARSLEGYGTLGGLGQIERAIAALPSQVAKAGRCAAVAFGVCETPSSGEQSGC